MRKDTAVIISALILSIFCFVTDGYGKGLILLTGVTGFVAMISFLFTSSPMTDLTEDEEAIFTYEKKFLKIILPLVAFNILGFYLIYFFVGGRAEDNRLLLSFTTSLGITSLAGFILGMIISIFPYKNMQFADKYKRGIILGQLFAHGLAAIVYLITILRMLL